MLLSPGFREDDFRRLKTDALNFLKVSLREGNDEESGKEHLYNVIYANHPYGHHNVGRHQLAREAHGRGCDALLSIQLIRGPTWLSEWPVVFRKPFQSR